MNYIELLNHRFACKIFDENKTISADNEHIILEAARLSPSSFGLEPWKLLVIKNKELRERLKPACWNQNQITQSQFLVIFLSRNAQNFRGQTDYVKEKVSRKKLPQEMQDGYLNMIGNFMMGVETTEWAKRQCYIALSNMLNAAKSIEIDSCPIEGFSPEDVTKILRENTTINLDDFNVCVMAAFGYANMQQPPKFRAKKEDIIQII